jgi:Zn-finger nucleic acid-binding protein
MSSIHSHHGTTSALRAGDTRACPSCATSMTATTFTDHMGASFNIDICWPCHLIWFDHLESTALSPKSVIELFRRIHEHRSDIRNIVSQQGACPVCKDSLKPTSDISRGGRFTYQRCQKGHGRLISFAQFLREKNFVRPLTDAERQGLCATVRQVRCSSCGAGVDIAHDAACKHCGAPVSVLDERAVAKALEDFDAKANRPRTAATTESAHTTSSPYSPRPSDFADDNTSAGLTDLLVAGLAAIVSITLS